MAAFTPPVSSLPREVAFFPLPGALLLPGGTLPLNIFEPRYLAMVEEAMKAGRMFAMMLPDPAAPRGERGPAVYRHGCLGRIVSFAETDDGRFLVTLKGLARFRLIEELAGPEPYRRARVDYAGFEADLAPPAHSPAVDRAELLAALRAYFAARQIEANWEGIGQAEDAALITSLCMVCPFEPAEQQALLEAAGLAERARLLIAMMRIAAVPPAAEGGLPS